MSEKIFEKQNMEHVAASDLIEKVRNLKAEGCRLVQICARKVSEGFEILYSFDKDVELLNFKVTIPEEEEIQSITGEYWYGFVYENELHDLFGIKVKHIALDFGGNFYKLSQPTPWNPKN